MGIYSYDDFIKAAAGKGWSEGNGFSNADWALAQKNPDAGMSLYNYKLDYQNATTAQAKQKANQMAEQTRSQYGGYTAGSSGTGFYKDPQSPGSFEMSGEKPAFSYDLENDPVYAAYQKQYTREGQRATQNALGTAAAATGGIPSSYAAAAATQAGDYYASQLSDKVPELYQQAYNRYANEMNQYNTDRNFQYGQHLDEINAQTSKRQENMQNALTGAQFGDYSGLKGLGYNTDNIPAEYQKRKQEAQLAASMGDNSKFEAMGIKVNPYLTNGSLLYNLGAYQGTLGDNTLMNQIIAGIMKGMQNKG